MEEITTCIICYETFTDPQILPCDHSYCKGCINRMTKQSKLKCPECNTVSNVCDIRSDFRLSKFLDALTKHTEDLTKVVENTIPNRVPGLKLCELCEEHPISYRCEDCSECAWMCRGCKRGYEKGKATKSHKVKQLADAKASNIHKLQDQVETLNNRIAELNSAVAMCKERLDVTKHIEVTSLEACETIRAECHAQLDKHFDSVKIKINDVIKLAEYQITTDRKSCIDELTKVEQQTDDITELIAADDSKLAIDGDALIREAQSYIESLKSLAVDIPIPEIKLEINPEWKPSDASVLHITHKSHAAPATMATEPTVKVS